MDVLQAEGTLQAVLDISKATAPVSSAPPRAPKEVAKQAAFSGVPPSAGSVDAGICFDFLKSSGCDRGDSCRFRHVKVVDVPKK